MRVMRQPDAYAKLESNAAAIEDVLTSAAAAAGVPIRIQRVGAMMTVFFTDRDEPIRNLDQVTATRLDLFGAWHTALREHGVSWPPSGYEASFMTLAHDAAIADRIAAAAGPAFQAVAAAS